MPELPEVETVMRGLERRVLGRRVVAVEVLNPEVVIGSPEDFAAAIKGSSVVGLRRKGKTLAIQLQYRKGSLPRYLLIRLGMTGQIIVSPRRAPLEPHTHVRMLLARGGIIDGEREEIRYRDVRRFGRLRSCTREELNAVWDRLGPDAPEISEEQFFAATRGRAGSLKGWLLNQQMLSGLGNIYADEALFEARLHPLTQPGRLSRRSARRLHRAVRNVLRRAVNLQGTTFRDYIDIDGRPGNFSARLKVYQRTGGPCLRCRRPIRRLVIGGRSSHFCPNCQPSPRHLAIADTRRSPLRNGTSSRVPTDRGSATATGKQQQAAALRSPSSAVS